MNNIFNKSRYPSGCSEHKLGFHSAYNKLPCEFTAGQPILRYKLYTVQTVETVDAWVHFQMYCSEKEKRKDENLKAR